MPPALVALIAAAEAVALTLDLGSPVLLRRREDALYVAVVEWRVSQRMSLGEVASDLALAAGVPGSLGLAVSSITRRCRG